MKNSSKKINQPKKCQAERYDYSPCNRPIYDDRHCIFHSENIEQKKDDFDKAFWEEFERQKKEDKCYDFSSFIFPGSISFNKIKFDKDVYFDRAQFTGENTSFEWCKFTGKVTSFSKAKFTANWTSFLSAKFTGNKTSFRGAEFTEKVTFSAAEFKGNETSFFWATFTGNKIYFSAAEFTGNKTSFIKAKFTGNETSFGEVKFKGDETNLSGAKFTGNETSFLCAEFTSKVTSFQGAEFKGKEISFGEVQFLGNVTSFRGAEFTGKMTSFSGAEFKSYETDFCWTKFIGEETDFRWATFTCNVTLYSAVFKNVLHLFDKLTIRKWLFLKKYLIKDWRFYLQPETANRHPLVNRLVNDAWYLEEFKLRHPIAYFLWKITSDCGRSMLLWAAWALGIALAFGVIFMRMGPEAFNLSHAATKYSFFYYGIVTFMTLGFGDIIPKTLNAEILVTIEVILGYIMLGGLISILANKLARRS